MGMGMEWNGMEWLPIWGGSRNRDFYFRALLVIYLALLLDFQVSTPKLVQNSMSKIPVADVQAQVNIWMQHFVDYPPSAITKMQVKIEADKNENAVLKPQNAELKIEVEDLKKEREELRNNQNADQKVMAGWAGAEGCKIEASAKADEEQAAASAKADEVQVPKILNLQN